jgi:probable rRNA maturation factor
MLTWLAALGKRNFLTIEILALTFTIEISSRQRSRTINKSWLKHASQELALATLANLRKKKPKHLTLKALKELESRGVLSLSLVSNRQIKELNAQWRGKNAATDVLSFPMGLVPPEPGIAWEFGEIIISVEKAEAQAKEYGHSFNREMAFLVVHGFLHLLGFDHETKQEEKEMFGRQKQILDACAITR